MTTILFFKEKKEQFKKNLKHLCFKSIWNRKIEEKDNVYMFLLH